MIEEWKKVERLYELVRHLDMFPTRMSGKQQSEQILYLAIVFDIAVARKLTDNNNVWEIYEILHKKICELHTNAVNAAYKTLSRPDLIWSTRTFEASIRNNLPQHARMYPTPKKDNIHPMRSAVKPSKYRKEL